jgi:DNA-binding XRE family transcriptional regulator
MLRVEHLLSIRELGELAGVSSSTVYSIESGRTRPSLRVMRKLTMALGVEVQDVAEFHEAIAARQAPRPRR